MANHPMMLNYDKVEAILREAPNDIVRNLASVGVSVALIRFGKPVGQSDTDYEARLPAAPFDMAFYATVLIAMFRHTDAIKGILDGQSIAQASGWE
jgi:hypothetical protein